MTIREYINNPMGRGDASIPNRKESIDSLETKYQRLIRTKGNSIRMTIYVAKNRTDDIYFHMVIPTETERTNSYDVVIKFSDTNRSHKSELSISNYDISIFANSPSFAYTFAYVYRNNGLFVESLKDNLGKEIIKHSPEVRNRFGIVNYEKYAYFGARYIMDSKMMNRAFLSSKSKPYDKHILQKNVRTLDTILAEYKNAEAKLKHRKKKETRQLSGKSVVSNISAIKEVKKKTPKKKMGKIGKVKKI